MKRIVTLLLVIFAVAANAQSIRLFNGDAPMNNNDTVFLPNDGHGDQVDAFFGYQNLTSSTIEFKVRKEVIFQDPEADFSFCIGDCYTGNLSQPSTLNPNEMVASTDAMGLHTIYVGPSEPALVKYTFFRTDDESDKVSFYVGYGTGTGVREGDIMKVLRAFPNPATNVVNIDFAAPEQDAFLVIKNLTGKEVYRAAISNVGRKQISVSSFSPGVYLYGVESNDRMLCTKKLLIK